MAEKRAEINQGTYREIPKATFKEFVEIWRKNYAENNVKPSTLGVYNHIINKRLLLEFEDFLMTDISPTLLLNYVTKRRQVDVEKKEKIKSKGRGNKKRYFLDYIKQNSIEYLKRPRIDKHDIEILNPVEAKLLLITVTNFTE